MGANSGREVNHWSRLLVNFLLPCLFQKKRLPPSWLAEWYISYIFLSPFNFFFFFNFQLKFPVVYLNQSHDNPHQHGRFQCYYSLFPLWALVTSWCILLHLPTFFSLVVIPCFLNMLPPPPNCYFGISTEYCVESSMNMKVKGSVWTPSWHIWGRVICPEFLVGKALSVCCKHHGSHLTSQKKWMSESIGNKCQCFHSFTHKNKVNKFTGTNQH